MFSYIIQTLDKNKKYPSIQNLRYIRNDLFHMEEKRRNMSGQEFNYQWNKVEQLLNDFNFDMRSLISLKHINLVMNQHHKTTFDDILKKGKVT